jgi:hypothetical protein
MAQMIGQILHGGEWNVDHLEPGVRRDDVERSEPIDGLLEQAPRLIISGFASGNESTLQTDHSHHHDE